MTKLTTARAPQYFLCDGLPVKMELTPRGGLRVRVFDLVTKTFLADSRYLSRVMYDRDNLSRQLTEQEFRTHVSKLRPYRVLGRAERPRGGQIVHTTGTRLLR